MGMVALIVLGVGVWGVIQFNSIDRVGVALATVKAAEPQNFLVVGSDTRELAAKDSADAGGIFGGKGDVPPGGKRADTIVIARVDPEESSIEILSLPRDLWVKTSTGKSERINSAYNSGAQELIDVIKLNLGLSINHYVEVNFDGFKGLVEAVGGVPMYFDRPVRDRHTGLRVPKASCVNMDGVQALAFARSRYLEYSNGKRWSSDPTGDLGRISRQQIFLRRALGRVTDLNLTDLNTLRQLIGVGVQNVKLDSSLGIDDMTSLAKKFASFDSSKMVEHHLSTEPFRTKGGAEVLRVDKAGSSEVIGIFQGKKPKNASISPSAPTTVLAPASITIDVMNGTTVGGIARQAADKLSPLGFTIGEVGNTSTVTATTVTYAPGSEALAEFVANKISPTPKLKSDPTVATGKVVLKLAGGINLSAAAQAPAPSTPAAPGSAAPGSAAPAAPVPGPAVETPIGLTLGDPPAGVVCG